MRVFYLDYYFDTLVS